VRARSHCLILVACLALPMLAHAATCTITLVNVAFADYDVFTNAATKSTGKVKVKCTSGTNYTISLSPGSGTLTARVMTGGGNQLDYNLFTDSTHLTVWGDGTSGSVTVSGTGTGSNTAYTVYGLIPAKQNVPAGSYSDTITVTVTY
jgi:spore coat protein U-like protein